VPPGVTTVLRLDGEKCVQRLSKPPVQRVSFDGGPDAGRI
jgi:hypothetical protein